MRPNKCFPPCHGFGPHCSSSSSGAGAEEDAPAERMGWISIAAGASTPRGAAVAVSGGAGMCGECFRAYVFGKFKLAVTRNTMVRQRRPPTPSPKFSRFFPLVITN
ncbi:hypothetical protein HU200_039887 [Digitaria exilis]|uniref:Uncharacterized protein n=1 Tax=Digitaria exilis TaxID=1010633 RepID=A0A835EJC7_9POAL|nr:hypothetical protein HU200_039887 [Digitaria exilis]